jgi:hypothetical protein
MKKSEDQLMTAFNRVHNFLFPEKAHPQLGIFRIILCSTLFYISCWRQLNISQLGETALIPREMALYVFPDFYRPSIQWFFWPDQYVFYVHLSLILLLGLAALGLSNRFFLLLTWIIHQGVLNRNYAINFGADSIGGLFLFYLAMTHCCEFYTLKKVKKENPSSDLASIFFRLTQFQICIIYAYSGFEKLKGQTWWDGTALWTVFANPQFTEYNLKFLSHFPWVIALATFMTVFFEVYFSAFILNSKLRKWGLLAGLFFHTGIGFLLGLMPFSFVMISTYVLFLEPDFIDRMFKKFLMLTRLHKFARVD